MGKYGQNDFPDDLCGHPYLYRTCFSYFLGDERLYSLLEVDYDVLRSFLGRSGVLLKTVNYG